MIVTEVGESEALESVEDFELLTVVSGVGKDGQVLIVFVEGQID